MTILFQEDWNSYPNAIIDLQTKNKSFVRLAALYRDMGIKNNSFILALHNPELQGVDPFSPTLTQEQMFLIAVECKQNFWYFIREIARAPGGAIDDPILFKANRGSMALFWLFLNHITLFLIQPRQTGKSFSADTLDNYLLNIGCTDTNINLLTKDDTLRGRNLERLRDLMDELPFYLKQKGKGDISNTEKLTVNSLNNIYTAHVPQKSVKAAYLVGRGLDGSVNKIDEIAFIYNLGVTLPAMLASITAAMAKARRKNEPYGIIFTTTAGKKDDPDGKYAYEILSNSALWTESLFDCKNISELSTIIRRNSPTGELRVNITFNHRQLGFTDAWLKEALEISMSKGDDANRDFFNIWTSGSLTSPLSVELNKIIRDSQRSDHYNEITSPYGYITRWYIPANQIASRMATGHYILSLDSSDAVGGDDIAMVIRDIETGEVVATGNYNETNLITFSEWMCHWFIDYNNITGIIERRSTGGMIMDYIILMLISKDINPFKRLYNKIVQDADEDPDKFNQINKVYGNNYSELTNKYKKSFGFATSANGATSRTELYSTTLLTAAKTTGNVVYDVKTINQILGLVIRNGRVDHPEGDHDDLCISWLLGFWLLSKGKNLSYYGIDSKLILSKCEKYKQENNPTTRYENHQQSNIRSKIEILVETLKKEKDEFISYKLESQLKLLANQLNDRDKEVLSVDELIKNLKEYKKTSTTSFRRW